MVMNIFYPWSSKQIRLVTIRMEAHIENLSRLNAMEMQNDYTQFES
jgi:hypothetical protein